MNTLETKVLQKIGENVDSPDVFTDDSTGMAQIRDSINDAIEEISFFTGSYKSRYFVALRQNRTFYRFQMAHGHIAWITDAWLVTQKRRLDQTSLIKLQHFNPRWLYNTGSPFKYFPIGDAIGIWPRPSSDTDMLEINAVTIPGRYVSSTDRIKLRTSYTWAAVHFAVGEYYASRGDAKTAIYHHNQYLGRMGIKIQYPYASEYVPQFGNNKDQIRPTIR